MKKTHYGWVICFLCVLTIFCTIGMISNTFTLYLNKIIEENDLTKAQGSSLNTIRSFTTVLSMLITTKYYNKLGFRKGLPLALVLIAASFFIYSRGSSLVVFYMAATVSGLGYGLGTMIPVTMLVNNWFIKSKGVVLGFASAGAGMTPIIASPFISAMLEKGGVALSASVQSLFILLAAACVYILLRDKPEDMGLKPYGYEESLASQPEVLPDEVREEHSDDGKFFDKKDHYLIIAATFILGTMTAPCIDNAAPYMSSSGVSTTAITLSMTSFGILSIIGKFMYGAISDRKGAYISNYMETSIFVVGVTIGILMGNSDVRAVMFTGIMGLGFCLSSLAISIWTIDFYPKAQLNQAIKTLQMSNAIGGLVFSVVPGIVADVTGSYSGFYMYALLAAVLQLIIVQTRYKKYNLTKLK